MAKKISFKQMAEDILGRKIDGPFNTIVEQERVTSELIIKVFPHVAKNLSTASIDTRTAYYDAITYMYTHGLIKKGEQDATNS